MITVKDLGGPTVVARMTELSVPTVHGWARIPFQHAPTIERCMGGAVLCEELCPDRKWVRVPDAAWPHPGGRPLLDLARATPNQEAA